MAPHIIHGLSHVSEGAARCGWNTGSLHQCLGIRLGCLDPGRHGAGSEHLPSPCSKPVGQTQGERNFRSDDGELYPELFNRAGETVDIAGVNGEIDG